MEKIRYSVPEARTQILETAGALLNGSTDVPTGTSLEEFIEIIEPITWQTTL